MIASLGPNREEERMPTEADRFIHLTLKLRESIQQLKPHASPGRERHAQRDIDIAVQLVDDLERMCQGKFDQPGQPTSTDDYIDLTNRIGDLACQIGTIEAKLGELAARPDYSSELSRFFADSVTDGGGE